MPRLFQRFGSGQTFSREYEGLDQGRSRLHIVFQRQDVVIQAAVHGMDTINLLAAGPGGLAFRAFAARLAGVFHQLVGAIEAGADAESVDRRALRQQSGDLVLVKVATAEDADFAIKGHRYLTHVKRLLDPEQPLQQSREAAAGLGGKLAVVLWQTPRSLHKDMVRLQHFAHALAAWPEVRHVLEFRHASWFDDEVAVCLCAHRIANCWSDAADWPLWDAVTADLVYLRLHGHARTYASAYSEGELDDWAERVRVLQAQGRDAFIYFDNTAAGAALHNAQRLKELLG